VSSSTRRFGDGLLADEAQAIDAEAVLPSRPPAAAGNTAGREADLGPAVQSVSIANQLMCCRAPTFRRPLPREVFFFFFFLRGSHQLYRRCRHGRSYSLRPTQETKRELEPGVGDCGSRLSRLFTTFRRRYWRDEADDGTDDATTEPLELGRGLRYWFLSMILVIGRLQLVIKRLSANGGQAKARHPFVRIRRRFPVTMRHPQARRGAAGRDRRDIGQSLRDETPRGRKTPRTHTGRTFAGEPSEPKAATRCSSPRQWS